MEYGRIAQELARSGFTPAAPTATAWLGVVPYLTGEAFAATVRVLAACAPGSSVVFDYGQPREVLSLQEQLMRDSMSARVAQAGEPFRLFFTPAPLARELAEMRYLWQTPLQLDNAKLVALLSKETHTDLDVAVRTAIEGLKRTSTQK